MHEGDLNLIHFNEDNYTCYSCHEHQGVVCVCVCVCVCGWGGGVTLDVLGLIEQRNYGILL